VALDANLRLKRKHVSSDEADPGLSKGYLYVVEETEYKEHLKKYKNEKEPVGDFHCLCLSWLTTCDRKALVPYMMQSTYRTLVTALGTLPLALGLLTVHAMI
jgi:hypothetical protein